MQGEFLISLFFLLLQNGLQHNGRDPARECVSAPCKKGPKVLHHLLRELMKKIIPESKRPNAPWVDFKKTKREFHVLKNKTKQKKTGFCCIAKSEFRINQVIINITVNVWSLLMIIQLLYSYRPFSLHSFYMRKTNNFPLMCARLHVRCVISAKYQTLLDWILCSPFTPLPSLPFFTVGVGSCWE